MSTHTLEQTQIVPISLEKCWSFFSNPRNLAKITPSELDFQILSDLPEEMFSGMKIEYRVRPLLGIPMKWVSEITEVETLRRFKDVQLVGPYHHWCHEHVFRALDANHTEMRDSVRYSLPFGPLGDLVHSLVVKRQLASIFGFRNRAVESLFGS